MIQRTSTQLFRDCLRLVAHVAGRSKKGDALRAIVRGEFRKNAKVTDPATVEGLKSNAVKALANYLMLESAQKDQRLKQVSNQFYKNESKELKESGSNISNNSNSSSSSSNDERKI